MGKQWQTCEVRPCALSSCVSDTYCHCGNVWGNKGGSAQQGWEMEHMYGDVVREVRPKEHKKSVGDDSGNR